MVTHYDFDNTNSEDYVDTASDERIDVLRNDDWIWSGRDSGGKVIRQ